MNMNFMHVHYVQKIVAVARKKIMYIVQPFLGSANLEVLPGPKSCTTDLTHRFLTTL